MKREWEKRREERKYNDFNFNPAMPVDTKVNHRGGREASQDELDEGARPVMPYRET